MKKTLIAVAVAMLSSSVAFAAEPAKPADPAKAPAQPATPAEPAKSAAAPAAPASGDIKVDAKACKSIANRECVDAGEAFSVADGQIVAWTRVTGAANSKVHHVWFKGDAQVSDIALNVGGNSWRTHSKKTLSAESKGDWRVEIRDDAGSVLETLKFKVE